MKMPLFITASLLCLTLLSNCTSTPKYQMTSAEDCLVVMKVDMQAGTSAGHALNARIYQYLFTGDYPPATLDRKWAMVVIREPTVRVKELYSRISPNSRFRGPDGHDSLDIPLPYKPGWLVVADFVFVQKITKGMEDYSADISLRRITETEREELLETFRNDPAYAMWQI